MIKLFFNTCLFYVFFMSAVVHAQEKISLQEAIDLALKNKAEAKKAALQITKAEYKIDEAKAGALPRIALSGGLTYNPVIQESLLEFGGQRIRAQFGQPWSANMTAVVQQTIFDQRVFTGLKAAKSTREFYVLNAQLTKEQIIENVATAYYQVFIQNENLKTVISSYENTEKVKKIIKSLVDNGLAKPIDLDRTMVQMANISATKQQLINAVELSKNALKFYIGIPMDQEIALVETSIEPNNALVSFNNSLDERSEVKLLQKQKELLEYNKKATEAYLYPTVALQANYGWAGTGGKFPLTNGLNNGVLWSDFSAIALNINIPIFSGGATKAKIKQTEIDLLDLQQDIDNTKQGLDLDLKNALTNIENTLITISTNKTNVDLAMKVQKNTQSNYQFGLATLTEVLDSENALTQAKQNYANALLNYKLAEIKLIKAKGLLETLQKSNN